MNGLKNDFVVIKGPQSLDTDQIQQLCDRKSGIGADGLLIVTPVDDSHVQMKYYNADGSVAEMCGNGLRCVARFAVENKLVKSGDFIVNTDAGPLRVTCNESDFKQIEVQVGRLVIEAGSLNLLGFDFIQVNVGNPHVVVFVDDVSTAPVKEIGPKVEVDKHFPNKTNVEFVESISEHEIRMRVWERGVGETQACATGMVVAAGAAVKSKKASYPVRVTVPGGSAKVWLDDDSFVRMIGPAEIEFKDSLEF